MVNNVTLILFLSVILAYPAFPDSFPGIEKLMTEKEYRASGLHKLSPEEITSINNWLIRYTAQDAKYIGRTSDEIKEKQQQKIISQIDGKFSGWRGKTLFMLKNGQVWQQRNQGVLHANLIDPEVIITRNIFGFYKMKIKSISRVVSVKRIK